MTKAKGQLSAEILILITALVAIIAIGAFQIIKVSQENANKTAQHTNMILSNISSSLPPLIDNKTNKTDLVNISKQGEFFCGVSTKGKCSADEDCIRGGCSGQICQSKFEKMVYTTCEYLSCYNAANYGLTCGCVDGKCEWHQLVANLSSECEKDEDCINTPSCCHQGAKACISKRSAPQKPKCDNAICLTVCERCIACSCVNGKCVSTPVDDDCC